MQLKILFILFFIASCLNVTIAQDSLVFIRGLPHTGDTTDQTNVSDVPPYNNFRQITLDEIPTPIKRELNTNKLYEGWEKSDVALDVNTKFYWVNIPVDSVIRTYIFHKHGDLIRMEEKIPEKFRK